MPGRGEVREMFSTLTSLGCACRVDSRRVPKICGSEVGHSPGCTWSLEEKTVRSVGSDFVLEMSRLLHLQVIWSGFCLELGMQVRA